MHKNLGKIPPECSLINVSLDKTTSVLKTKAELVYASDDQVKKIHL